MKSFSLLAFSLSVIALGCANEPARINGAVAKKTPPSSNSNDNSISGNNLTAELKAAQQQKDDLTLQKEEADEQLTTLQLINNRMCLRLFTYRSQCPVSARLRSTDNEKVLGCVGNYEEGARLVPKYSIKLTAPEATGTFFLRADNGYDSMPFSAGGVTEVLWSPLNASDTQAPRIWDLTQLKLKTSPGSKITVAQISEFEFRVNDKAIINKQALSAVADSSTTIDVALDSILAWKNQSAKNTSPCLVTDEEIDGIITGAKNDAKTKAALSLEDTQGLVASDSDAKKLDSLNKDIVDLKKTLSDSTTDIDRESDRSGKLTLELTGDRNIGCFAKLPISTLELEINGAHLANKPIVIEATPRHDVDNPRQFIFRFGEQFAQTNPDEEQLSYFINAGHFLSHNFSGKRIGDIEYISIEKGGVGFDAFHNCWNTMFGQKCEWQNSEKNMYRLDSLALKVNGEVLYRSDAINFTFQEGKLVWADKNISLNQAFRTLMHRTDCPAQ